jgi:hypothetical protein
MTDVSSAVKVNTNKIVFPTKPHETELNPKDMIIFGKEKCGKTTILSELPNCLIIDTENGSAMVEAMAVQVPKGVGPVTKMNWLKQVANQLKTEPHPYEYIAIDTLTEVDEWSEWSGTYRYMNTPQGASFNRVKDAKGNPIKYGEMLDPTSDEYESVHTIGEGFGYRWSRNEMMDIYNMFTDIPGIKCTIFVCHIEDKYLGNKDADAVREEQLALTGKIRKMLPRKVDVIGYVYNDKGTIKVSFTTNEEKVGGTRAKHLRGYNDVFDWKKVFI